MTSPDTPVEGFHNVSRDLKQAAGGARAEKWAVCGDYNECVVVVEGATDDGNVVCMQPDMEASQEHWPRRRALIAAAPDLLEALADIVEFCDDPSGSEQGESLAFGLSRLLPAARAALAKALLSQPRDTSDLAREDEKPTARVEEIARIVDPRLANKEWCRNFAPYVAEVEQAALTKARQIDALYSQAKP